MTDDRRPGPSGLEAYQPSGKYHLLAENELRRSDYPTEKNLISILFEMENCHSPEEMGRILQRAGEWLKDPGQQRIRSVFQTWLHRIWLQTRLPTVIIPEVLDLQEVGAMLAERVKEWTTQWREDGLKAGKIEGKLEGKEEGKKEGMKEGEAAVLLRQLDRKFGSLSDEHRKRIAAADSETLLEWADRVLTAVRLEEVFG